MKKVFKSRIFLCIIVGICCIGIGVYAANTYEASEIVYNASNGETMNVNDALNALYNNKGFKTINIQDEYTITTSNSNARGSNIDSVNIGKDNFYNLTGSVNYAQNVTFAIEKDLSKYKFLKLYIEYSGKSYNNKVELTVGNSTPLSFNIVPNNEDTFTKILLIGINDIDNNKISVKISAGANVPNCLSFNIGISLMN